MIRVFTVMTVTFVATGYCADWPQFLGPHRDGSSPESGLISQWDGLQPRIVWEVEGGKGQSQVVVSGGRGFTLMQRGHAEVVVALDAATGRELWARSIGKIIRKTGPSATPAIDGDHLYVQSMSGPLLCLETGEGKVVWQRNLLEEFSIGNTLWGMSVSPLVEGDIVFSLENVALEKTTGNVRWNIKDRRPDLGFTSPVSIHIDNTTQVVFMTGKGGGNLLAVRPGDGQRLWSLPWQGGDGDANAATPLLADGRLFISSGDPCGLLEVAKGGNPRILWNSKGHKPTMETWWSTAVYRDHYLYGFSGGASHREDLNCVNAETGELVWSQQEFGGGNITLADGKLYILTNKGELVVALATPSKYVEAARAKVLRQTSYINAPSIAGKRLYARDLKNIICVDIDTH